jgi:multidrug efflux pump subunit AcrA (membrane-fusion protein)
MKGIISRKSDNIELKFQAERIEVDIDNRDNRLSPGMYAEMTLHLKGNLTALSVPRSAVVTSTEKKYVWVIRNGKNVQEPVTTGNENQDRIEIFGNITAGERVIANATDEIK